MAVDAAVLILRAFGHDASGRVVRFPEPLPGGGNHKPAWAGLISDAYPTAGERHPGRYPGNSLHHCVSNLAGERVGHQGVDGPRSVAIAVVDIAAVETIR